MPSHPFDSWTKTEIRNLKSLYETSEWDKLFQALPSRSKVAITVRAQKLGLKRGPLYYSKIKKEGHPHWRGGKVEILCQHCNKAIKVDKSRIGLAKFCSKSCQVKHRAGKKHWHWQGGKVKKSCPICGKAFLEYANVPSHKFCSKKCGGIAHRNRVMVTCPTCGKQRSITVGNFNRGRRFCNARCHRLHRPTSIEYIIQTGLTNAGVEFVPEYRIGRWSIDVFIPAANLAVECDGVYWHRIHKDRDRRKDKFLRGLGIRVIRLTEQSILSHPEKCFQRVISAMAR